MLTFGCITTPFSEILFLPKMTMVSISRSIFGKLFCTKIIFCIFYAGTLFCIMNRMNDKNNLDLIILTESFSLRCYHLCKLFNSLVFCYPGVYTLNLVSYSDVFMLFKFFDIKSASFHYTKQHHVIRRAKMHKN